MNKTEKQPEVTVIIPVYNAFALLTRCIESVLKQTGKFLLEIIVVNDGSTDDSIELVKNFKNDNIKILNQSNQGPASARNYGLRIAKSKYVAFLDADDYWKPEFIEKTHHFLEQYPKAIAVSTGQLHKMIDKSSVIIPRFLNNNSNKTRSYILENFFSFWADNKHVCTGSVLMRTDIVKEIGGQRTDLRICEDLEFWFYLATFGQWGFIPEILFVSDGTLVTKKQGWFAKNKIRWQMSPTVEQWQSRILPRLNHEDYPALNVARGRVGWISAYSRILSCDDLSAKKIVLEYGDFFPKYLIIKLAKLGASSGVIVWKTFCILLRFKESLKKIFYSFSETGYKSF